MSGPHVTLDPDPLIPPEILTQAKLDEAWEQGYADAREGHPRPLEIVLAAVAGGILGATLALVGAGIVHAAPRSGPDSASASVAGGANDQGQIGAPRDGMPVDAAAEAGRVVAAPVASVGAPPDPPAMEGGTATYCAPTPTHCQSWGGDAHLAAVESFSFGDRPYAVRVCLSEGRGDRCTVVTVVSYCDCGGTLIDLSLAAFEDLAPRWRGRIPVSVQEIGADVTAPPTDVELP